MRPANWYPPMELSPVEEKVVSRIKRAKLFTFLRHNRHEIFDDGFQQELAKLFKDSSVGQKPVYPAQLALATILQAYTGISDDEVLEVLLMDRRWQLVLDCLDCEQTPFGKGTFVRFRAVLIAQDFDRRLLERTVEIAQQRGGFSPRSLRAALDSSPLWGAARVEDTYNLLGHALRKALGIIAQDQERDFKEVATEAGAACVADSSLKAALDLDWDDPVAKTQALSTILQALAQVEFRIQQQPDASPKAAQEANETLLVARQIQQQDVEVESDGSPKLRRGVAKDRRITLEDAQMSHGRKSRKQRFDGYKRHVLKDLDIGVVRAVGLTPANMPEASVTDEIIGDLKGQSVSLRELHIDRAYLASNLVKERSEDLNIVCKAWPVRNGKRFTKLAFTLDWQGQQIHCPNGVSLPFEAGQVVRFPAATCANCPLQPQCTTSQRGRSVSIHPDEQLFAELRQRQATPAGRAQLRQRVQVEHSLAQVSQWQGNRARYRTQRQNLFDLRRIAVVHNLHVIARMPEPSPGEIAA